MKLPFVFLAIVGQTFIHSAHGVMDGICSCITPQYLESGKNRTIACNFTSAIDVIYWYDTNDTLHNTPAISWYKKSQGETGFASGGYKIQPNGSLLIKGTISEGDLYFSVVMLYNELIVCKQNIHVIVFENQQHQSSYLAIDKCDRTRYCHKRVDSGSPLQLSCHPNGAVVSRPILWELWTSGEPRPLEPAGRTFSAENVSIDTKMSLTLPFTGQRLDVIVCKIEDNFAYEVKSSTILVEWTNNNSVTQYKTITPIYKSAELKSTVRLDCGGRKQISFVWKMCHTENKYNCVDVVHFALENKVFLVPGLSADNSGTLFVEEVDTHHEGWYWCYSSNGRHDTERYYRLDVYAFPVPLKPIVAECDNDYFCEIESGLKGVMTCSLFGVRPEARLDWIVLSVPSSKIISLEKKEQTVISHEGVYDISMKTLYKVESLQFSKIDLECRASVNITLTSSLSTRVQLRLSDRCTSGVENHQSPNPVSWILLTLGLLVLTACVVIIYNTRNFHNRRQDESNQVSEEPMHVQRNRNNREHLEEDFRIRLSALKLNIARIMRLDDALRLSDMFNLGEKEQNAVSSSKNPAVTLIDVLLNGDEMSVKYNLSELERTSKICDMTEVNQLLNSFIRSHFLESFLLKVKIMKGNGLAKEDEEFFHKLLWDYSEIKTISELQAFFGENYSTTISSVQEGSLDILVNMPPTELLDKLWMDIQSGILATKLFLIVLKNMKHGDSHENKLELKVVCDTKDGKRIKEMTTKSGYAAKGKRNDVTNQYESHKNRYGNAEASESPTTALMEMVATMTLQMANFIGSKEAWQLCNHFRLSQERSEQIRCSPNPGLEVIISLIKKDQTSLERIINDLDVAAWELSLREVNYILQKFKRNVCENQANNLENSLFSSNRRMYVTLREVDQFWRSFFTFVISALFKFIGCEGTSVPFLNRVKKIMSISEESVGPPKRKETQKDETRDDSDPNFEAIRQLYYKIISEMKLVECQQLFNEYDVFLLNLAVKHIDEWNKNCAVDVNKTWWARNATFITIFCGLLLSPYLSTTDAGVIWTLFSIIIVCLYSPIMFRNIHIEGIEAMQMDLSPLLSKLITIIRAVDQITIKVTQASRIIDKLHTLSEVDMTKKLSDTRCHLERQLQLCRQQRYRHDTSFVDTVKESVHIITTVYNIIHNFPATVNSDQTKISSEDLNLNDAISYIIDNANADVIPPSLRQFLLLFNGIVDDSYHKSDRSIKDIGVELPWKRNSGRQKLSLQSLSTSMVARAIPQASLQDRPTTEMPSVVARNGIILKNSGIFISFGDIGRKVVGICEDFGVEPSFVFEQLQDRMMALKDICMNSHTW